MMELSRARSVCKRLKNLRGRCGQGQNRTADTRIFSPLTVPRLCGTIGHHLNLFKRLTPTCSQSISQLEHIAAYSSGKVNPMALGSSPPHCSVATRALTFLSNLKGLHQA
jgi:hypothetical protein